MIHTPITYPLGNAIEAAKALQPHASKDDVVPVLNAVQCTHDGWYATDRYSVGHYNIYADTPTEYTKHLDNPKGYEHLLPREAVEWISKINTRQLRRPYLGDSDLGYSLRITWQETIIEDISKTDDVEVAIMFGDTAERTQTFEPVNGNYPPVARLLHDWKPADEAYPLALNPVHLEKVTAYAKRASKDKPVTLTLGRNEHGTDKPAPIRATYGALTAIIQPNLNLDRNNT